MDLKNRVMSLYEEILAPVKARKIVLLLKYVIIDEETDINKIKKEIPISEETLKKYVGDNYLMLQYLTQEELDAFRVKIDKLLDKNEKLRRLIKLVLHENETNLEKITAKTPIAIDTIKNYMSNKELLSKYLTKEEIEVFLSKLEAIMEKTNKKLQRLIKVVLVDGETDLEEIEKKGYIKIDTIRKHLDDPKELKKYLTETEFNILENKLRKLIENWDNRKYLSDVKLMKQIIDDIFHTRYIYREICQRNFTTWKKFETLLHNEEFMNKEFPVGTVEKVKEKIRENDSLRRKVPRDCFVIEDRFCIIIANKNIHYLNQFDTKKLNFVSYYLGTGANLDLVIKKFGTSLPETLAILSDAKLEHILDEKYYNVLKQCLNIEKLLLGNDLNLKREFTLEVTNFLHENEFDTKLAMVYFRIPEPLFNKVLYEIIKLPYASIETKDTIKSILNINKEEKTK